MIRKHLQEPAIKPPHTIENPPFAIEPVEPQATDTDKPPEELELSVRDTAILALNNQGADVRQIAQALKIHPTTVYKIVQRHNALSPRGFAALHLFNKAMRAADRILDGKAAATGMKKPETSNIIKVMEMVVDRVQPKTKTVNIKTETHTFIELKAGPAMIDAKARQAITKPDDHVSIPNDATMLCNQAVSDGKDNG